MFMWLPSAEASVRRWHARPVAQHHQHWSAPGTCGEFLQGRLDGVDFLINSPIDCYSTAVVRRTSGSQIGVVDAALRSKVVAAMVELGERLSLPGGFEVQVTSDLPQGKGMASSTADLVAAIGAMLAHAGVEWSTANIARLLVAIEPSDCTHVPGVGYVGHLCGTVFGNYSAPTDLRVLIVDCGGVVDTVGFDRGLAHAVYARNEPLLRSALSMALRGLTLGDVATLARAATISARLSQQILPKAQFDNLLALSSEHGGLGVNCAHSGSVLGLLYRPAGDLGPRLRRAVEHAFGPDLAIIGDHQFVSGGIHVQQRH